MIRIVISPFGLGERIDDDLIAPYYNTIIIKPLCENIYDYANLFNNKQYNKHHKIQFTQHIVFCKSDYSDLEDVINNVLNNYNYYLNRVIKYKNECYNYIKSNKYQNDFLEILNKSL